MLVSAISTNLYQAYKASENSSSGKATETSNDTAFNSLITSVNKKTNIDSSTFMPFDAINEWKYFCHKQILNSNLDIIA